MVLLLNSSIQGVIQQLSQKNPTFNCLGEDIFFQPQQLSSHLEGPHLFLEPYTEGKPRQLATQGRWQLGDPGPPGSTCSAGPGHQQKHF